MGCLLLSYLVLKAGSLIEPGVHWFGEAGWPATYRDQLFLALTSPALVFQSSIPRLHNEAVKKSITLLLLLKPFDHGVQLEDIITLTC